MQATRTKQAATIYESFFQALAFEPTPNSVHTMETIMRALGDGEPVNENVTDAQLAYADRFLTPTSARYVPPFESCFTGAARAKTGYAPLYGPAMTSSSACYDAYGFDYRALPGFSPLIGTLSADHLVAQIAFMAALRHRESDFPHARADADTFVATHLLRWVPLYVAKNEAIANDYVTRAARALLAWIRLDAQG